MTPLERRRARVAFLEGVLRGLERQQAAADERAMLADPDFLTLARTLVDGRGEAHDAIDRALDRLEGTIARKQQGNPYHDAQGHFTNPAGVGHAAPGPKGKARGRRARLRRLKARFRRHRDRLKARHRSERKALRDRHRSEREAASPSHRESTAAYHREERERLAAAHKGERADLRARVRERADAIKSSGRGAKAEPARDLADADPKAVESAWNELGGFVAKPPYMSGV